MAISASLALSRLDYSPARSWHGLAATKRPSAAFLAGAIGRERLAAVVGRRCRQDAVQAQSRATDPVRVQALSVVWAAAAAGMAGVFAGLLIAKAAQAWLGIQVHNTDPLVENARLRAKVEELQQMMLKYEPMSHKTMKLRFTKGINKAVILGLVDELLSRKEVNIWWLPDSIERIFYCNVISLMLSVMDEVVEGMSIALAGHNVKLQLTYLDVAEEKANGSPRSGV